MFEKSSVQSSVDASCLRSDAILDSEAIAPEISRRLARAPSSPSWPYRTRPPLVMRSPPNMRDQCRFSGEPPGTGSRPR